MTTYTICVNEDTDVDVDISYSFIDALVSKFEYHAEYSSDEKDTTYEDAKLLKKLLERIKGQTLYGISGYVEEIDVEDKDISHIANDQIEKETHEYINRFKSQQRTIIENEGVLINQIDQVAYRYGNKKELTREDAIAIRQLIDKIIE